MASNQLAFHASIDSLQNGMALSTVHYFFNNRKAVVLTSMALACRINPMKVRTRLAQLVAKPKVIHAHYETPVHDLPIVADTSARYGKVEVPNGVAATEAKPAKPIAKAPAKKPTYIWKPGHGAIEKVDRSTGEIFHLCEVNDQEQAA